MKRTTMAVSVLAAAGLMAAVGFGFGLFQAPEMEAQMEGPRPNQMMQSVGSTTWEGMRISVARAEPSEFMIFQGQDSTRVVEPQPADSVHLMAVLEDAETGERIPYSTVWFTITDDEGSVVFDDRTWPMLSKNMGTHYGVNVGFPEPGTYNLEVQVGPPISARHPEYMDRWREPFTFELQIEWGGEA